jgi:hypothetical protein
MLARRLASPVHLSPIPCVSPRLGFNAGAIGLALGAYGTRLMEAIVLHGTLELAAFALAGGAYLRARRGALGPCALLGAGAASFVLLAAAALVEAWVAPGAAV